MTIIQHDHSVLGARNIGPTIAARLKAVGIETLSDLRKLGAVEAYKRIVSHNPGAMIPVCYYLYSLQGALDGVHWNALPGDIKHKLLLEAKIRGRR